MVNPKVILNEDYLDLRNCPQDNFNSRSNTGTYITHAHKESLINNQNSKNDGVRLEKELINCGLKKLVNSYNATAGHAPYKLASKKKLQQRDRPKFDPRFRRFLVPEDKRRLKSQSEVSVTPAKAVDRSYTTSTPLFPSKKTSDIEIEASTKKHESHKNKFTMTKTKSTQEQGLTLKQYDLSLGHQRPLCINYVQDVTKFIPLKKDYTKNQQKVDPRLCEKYSVLKMPWKRTWTIPVLKHKSSTLNSYKNVDHSDRQTYVYDDGTEIDSLYVNEKHKQIFSSVFESQFMGVLFLGGSICGILLVSLLIWFIFGFDFFKIFFKPRDVQEVSLKRYVKRFGGMVVYYIGNMFKAIGRALVTPTQNVYQPPDRYRWPPMQRVQLQGD